MYLHITSCPDGTCKYTEHHESAYTEWQRFLPLPADGVYRWSFRYQAALNKSTSFSLFMATLICHCQFSLVLSSAHSFLFFSVSLLPVVFTAISEHSHSVRFTFLHHRLRPVRPPFPINHGGFSIILPHLTPSGSRNDSTNCCLSA